jgi:acetamidase/formamidase
MAKGNVVKSDTFHYKWSRDHKPVLHVKPGEKVTFQVNEVTSWQITKDSRPDDLTKTDGEKFYPLAGPVSIDGAKPGDALVVDVIDVKTADWGWTGIIPGLGLLEEFDKPYLYIWDLKNEKSMLFKKGIEVPIRPFCGVNGVAPAERGYFDVMPPGPHGGNMDNRHLTAGSRIFLPVFVEGGLFSVGDVHAAQGDGEVCVTAVECPGEVTLGFDLAKGMGLRSPHYLVASDERQPGGLYGTTGIASDLWEATKLSVRNMLDHLTSTYGLTPEEAYVLCSVCADLRIHEVVDRPNWVVGTVIPLDIFPTRRTGRR